MGGECKGWEGGKVVVVGEVDGRLANRVRVCICVGGANVCVCVFMCVCVYDEWVGWNVQWG